MKLVDLAKVAELEHAREEALKLRELIHDMVDTDHYYIHFHVKTCGSERWRGLTVMYDVELQQRFLREIDTDILNYEKELLDLGVECG